MDSEPPQIGAPIALNAPQRPLRIGRGDKYYEVLYVGGVAQERRLGRRTNQDEARNSFILDSQQQEQKEEQPVLDAQDLPPPVSELNPQPSVRRRRSRQGLAVQPTPPLRRHRPGSIRSKESTPSRESSEASISEELVRENSAQPTLYVLPEQESELLSGSPGPVILTPKINPASVIPIYDKPRHIYNTVVQDMVANDVNAEHSVAAGARGRESFRREDLMPRHLVEQTELQTSGTRQGEQLLTEDELRLRDSEIQMQRQHDSLRQQQEERRRQQEAEAEHHKQQQEELAKQQRIALQLQQQGELEERQRLEFAKQQRAEIQKQRQLKEQQEAEILRQSQAESRRREEAEIEQQQLQIKLQLEFQRQQKAEQQEQQQAELQRQQQVELQRQQQAELKRQQQAELQRQQQAELQRQQQAELQRQQQAELQRQQQAELQRQQQAEIERQQQAKLQRQQQEELERQLELQRQQQAELQRQQQAELQRQQQAELQRQQQAELQRQQQAELQRQQQAELQRQQQAELQRQQQVELQRQQETELQKQQQAELDRQQTELQRQQQGERQRQQEAEIVEQQQRELVQARRDQAELRGQLQREEITQTSNIASNQEWSQEQPAGNLFRKLSAKGTKAEDNQAKATLTIPKAGASSNERDEASPSRNLISRADSPRRQRSRSPHSMRYVTQERHGSIGGESRAHSEQSQFKQTAPKLVDRRAESDIPSGHGNNDIVTDGQYTIQYVASTPMRAPVGHRETPKEPTLGTTSPESLVDWYENDENFPAGGDEEDEHDGNVKRKPSKIIRKIKGLFENKKPDETPSSTSAERKRSDQLEPPPSPREPTTPTKRSKLGQFFSFNKKDERKRASPPPPLTFAPAVQGPEDIPDGMLAKVFRSKCNQERGAEQPATPKTAPPFLNFRDWSPSTEDLSTVGTGKEKEFTKPSKYFVPKIPPFQPRSQASPSPADRGFAGPPADRLGESLLAPDAPEARNSPYSLCRNRGSVKGTSPRRTSIVEGNVNAVYEEFFEKERTGFVPNSQKPVEEPPGHTFVRKPSKKAAAIPPELRAPIYQPVRDEIYSGAKQSHVDPEPRRTPPTQPGAEQFPPEQQGGVPYIEIEEELIEEEILEEPGPVPDSRSSIQELRPLFKQAWMLIDFMTQDLIDGVPKEAWGELRIFFLIMIGMLVLLYAQGVLRFAGNNPLCVIKALFKGFQILLGSAIQAGMAIHDAVDAMLTDASSKIVADTLNEI